MDQNFFSARNLKKRFRTGFMGLFAGIFAWVWWFLLYPELCFPQDVYEVVYETGTEETEGSQKEICDLLLQADKEQVIVKSRLLEWLKRHDALTGGKECKLE